MNCWEMTWNEVQEAGEERQTIVSFEGYLLSSRDRRFEARAARNLYESSLRLAIRKGKPVPQKVLDENADLVARIREDDGIEPVVMPEPVKTQTEKNKRKEDSEREEEEVVVEVMAAF